MSKWNGKDRIIQSWWFRQTTHNEMEKIDLDTIDNELIIKDKTLWAPDQYLK